MGRARVRVCVCVCCSVSPSHTPQEETQDKDEWGKEEKPTAEEGAGEGEEEADAGSAAPAGRGGRGAPVPAPAAASLDDLLGLAPAPAPASGVDPLTVPVTKRVGVESPEAVARAWTALSLKPAGVLFEDAHIQVGVKRTFSGPEGKLALFIGNKSATTPYVAFKLRVPESAALRCTLSEVPSIVAPKSQARVELSVESLQPFLDAPALQLSFISEPGTGHAYALRVPAALHSFCEPIAMAGPDFKTRWGALAGAPREVTAMITPASGAGAVSIANANAALTLINMSAVDAGAPGATGASTYRTKTVAPNGQPISVGCLAMAIPDGNAGIFKVAVRTQHGDVSKSLVATLQAYLGGL